MDFSHSSTASTVSLLPARIEPANNTRRSRTRSFRPLYQTADGVPVYGLTTATAVFDWVKRNWQVVTAIGVAAFIFTRDDVTIHFGGPAFNTLTNTTNGTSAARAQTAQFALPLLGIGSSNDEGNEAKGSKKTKGAPTANTLSHLTFVMHPDYAAKHGIAASVVELHNGICRDYVAAHQKYAVDEMHRVGIPASVTLAQGLLESNAGASFLARNARNHFGIKCFSRSCVKGHCLNASDDTHKDFFRIYPSDAESYIAHSEFLKRDRYAPLFKNARTDYKAWAHGLKTAGYATNPHYAEDLIAIIETLGLQQYDKK